MSTTSPTMSRSASAGGLHSTTHHLPLQAALYARVSAAQQAQAQTIASQVAALRERAARDGVEIPAARHFCDEGYRGAVLSRPELERLRDLGAVGGLDRLSLLAPDRLARQYASQVILLEEFERAGVEVIFLNWEAGRSAEAD